MPALRAKVFFPNLNGLRFIASLLVLAAHLEQNKSAWGLPGLWSPDGFFSLAGALGVNLFFVLSGFLITYLLLAEERDASSISLGRFYLRRALRIWPLYLFIVAMALFALPHFPFFYPPGFDRAAAAAHTGAKSLLYFTFFANLVIPLYGVVPFASHAWSIGTEEQFYLLWPALLKAVRGRRLLLMAGVILFYLAALKLLPDKTPLKDFWYFFNIDCMAVGGCFALLLFRKSPWLRLWMHPALFYAALAAAAALIALGVRFPHLNQEIYAALFGVIILNFAANRNINVTLENRTLDYLGRISYGLYMFHPLGITLALRAGAALGVSAGAPLFALSLMATVIFAAVSYRFFESPFLRMKNRLSAPGTGAAGSAPEKPFLEAARP